ncbi:MupG family TIM beta-alpha barrel fold protein [Staphylococcus chromogenes]|uniref:MupG family TIM beta-alpha barrel fold protein n=1 Tax=Staphylococcus chromogenes TaxID=46126 RepID=UPI002888696A|nr:MupG family TIM beta-alpha barrel fold protein [Staphylococcus chromogenes]MDT0698277.1 MupG family TIM beta-alpha barrel fold protein [Staphylococcus chromogenes]
MLGFSVYLGKPFNNDYIQNMLNLGFRTVFTSIQIPEEQNHHSRLFELQTYLSAFDTALIIDVNESLINDTLFNQLSQFDTIRYILRIDEGATPSLIQRILNHGHLCCINASTVSEQFLIQLQTYPELQSRLIYLHNYYPRPDTGLSRAYLQSQNARIRHYHPNASIYAFISGEYYRGPLYEGLPTLESLRQTEPCLSALIIKQMEIDTILVGDPYISQITAQKMYDMIVHNHFRLHCHLHSNADRTLVLQEHVVRPDCAAHVIRSRYSRAHVSETIAPSNIQPRSKGTITIDNHLNGRYMGELQITKINLKPHPHVNVVGSLTKEALPYLNFFNASTRFTFVETVEEDVHETKYN